MVIDRNNIFDVTNKCNCKPDKDYGQNFLIEPLISEKIVSLLDIKTCDNVLEIGPGVGSLTHFISNSTEKYTVVDIDSRMCDFLKVVYPTATLICNDIRKVDVTSYNKILSNLPYNVTTEIITYLLLNAVNTEEIVLMCQSETFRHFFDVSGSEYGPVSVLIHLLGNIRREFNVKAGCFIPQPKCVSIVFRIVLNKVPNRDEIIDCYNFAKKVFNNRRKTILNNFSIIGIDKEKGQIILEKAGINPLSRPEDIKPEQYLELYRVYRENV